MNVVRCEKDHFFDSDKYDKCPLCSKEETALERNKNRWPQFIKGFKNRKTNQHPNQQLNADKINLDYNAEIRLFIVSKNKDVLIEKNPFYVGRTPECAIEFNAPYISTLHALFYCDDGTWFIEDLNSTNGVWINDVKLEPMKKYPLKRNDVIDLAHSEKLIFFKDNEGTEFLLPGVLQMNIKRCENCHFPFYSDKHTKCPICGQPENREEALSFSKEKPKQPELKFRLVLPETDGTSPYNDSPLYCCVMHHPIRSAMITPDSYPVDEFNVVHNGIAYGDSIKHKTEDNDVIIEFANSKSIDNNSDKIIVDMQWDSKVTYSPTILDAMESWDFVVSEERIDIDTYSDGYVFYNGSYKNRKDLEENKKRLRQLYDEKDSFVVEDDVLIMYLGSSADIVIPNNVKHIGNFVFVGLEKITSITIPDSVISIGAWAFKDCTNLTSITIPDSVTSIGNCAFYNTGYYNNPDNWENGVFYIDNCLTKAKSSVNSLCTVKKGTKIIADNAFDSCSNLTSVIIPDSVTTIGHHAFQNCAQLVSTTLGGSVTHIGTQAFKGCVNLSSATISDSVVLGFEAFYDYWKSKGLCTSCGSKFKGLLNKKCSRCGTPKVVMDATEPKIEHENLLK